MTKTIQKIHIEGMTCVNCKKILTKNILKIEGVTQVNVKLSEKELTVVFDSSKTALDKILQEILNQGYEGIPTQ